MIDKTTPNKPFSLDIPTAAGVDGASFGYLKAEKPVSIDVDPGAVLAPDDLEMVEQEEKQLNKPVRHSRVEAYLLFFALIFLLLVLSIFSDSIVSFNTLSPALAAVYAATISIVVAPVMVWFYRQYHDYKSLVAAEELQFAFSTYSPADTEKVKKITQHVAHLGNSAMKAKIQDILNEEYDSSIPEKTLKRLDHALESLDAEAEALCRLYAIQTFIGTTISPIAVLDLSLVLWRSSRLVRDVAKIYGIRPSSVNQLILLRKIAEAVTFSASAEIAREYVVETLGGSALATVAASVSQGAVSGVFVRRVGAEAIRACRPLPYRRKTDVKGFLRELLRKYPQTAAT